MIELCYVVIVILVVSGVSGFIYGSYSRIVFSSYSGVMVVFLYLVRFRIFRLF